MSNPGNEYISLEIKVRVDVFSADKGASSSASSSFGLSRRPSYLGRGKYRWENRFRAAFRIIRFSRFLGGVPILKQKTYCKKTTGH